MLITSCADMRQLWQCIYLLWFQCSESVTMTTGMHIFHITDIYPWENMSATFHIHVSLHLYCSIHIESIFLHTSIKNQWTATYINQTTAKYVLGTNMPLKCHISGICPSYLTYICWGSMPMYVIRKKLLWLKLCFLGRATDRWEDRMTEGWSLIA